ncbi:hypothetical protein HS088_TW08G00329 [Tripterygium wilfordii]|uniref:Oleosin n=1 Tax=Tripterygium wilfordii TaxID=458696 RepID=A0A7J7DBK5_TRIWF|nr:oleosin 16.4 kDa-like [Tripterygium wilfordii]KAF5743742.1 hypothetical protein HS088_TW08G00329 [Tripterygium wilfordii]
MRKKTRISCKPLGPFIKHLAFNSTRPLFHLLKFKHLSLTFTSPFRSLCSSTQISTMADQQLKQQDPTQGIKSLLPEQGISKTHILAAVTLIPVGGFLLFLGGLALLVTFIGLALATPVFVIFSPILVPAGMVTGLALIGFLTAGALGITAMSSLSWLGNFIRRLRKPADKMDQAKRRVQDTAGQMGSRAKETGQSIQGKVQEVAKTLEGQKT